MNKTNIIHTKNYLDHEDWVDKCLYDLLNESKETNRLLRKLAGETEPSLTNEDKAFFTRAKDVVDDLMDDGKRNHSNKSNKKDKKRGR